jgi:hypothetical protein
MFSPREYRRFVLNIALSSEPEKAGNKARRKAYRETLATHMIGVLCASLALVAIIKLPQIWFGTVCLANEIAVWLNPPPQGKIVVMRQPDESFERSTALALAGRWLGIAGIWSVRRTRGSISALSIIGITLTTIALLPLYLMMAVFLLTVALPILLPVLGVTAVKRTAERSILADDRSLTGRTREETRSDDPIRTSSRLLNLKLRRRQGSGAR